MISITTPDVSGEPGELHCRTKLADRLTSLATSTARIPSATRPMIRLRSSGVSFG